MPLLADLMAAVGSGAVEVIDLTAPLSSSTPSPSPQAPTALECRKHSCTSIATIDPPRRRLSLPKRRPPAASGGCTPGSPAMLPTRAAKR